MDTKQLTVELVPLDRVYGSPSNPRHNDEAVPHVEASLRRFGWQQPIVAKPSGEVIAGNTRLKAAAKLGMTEVPVVWFDGSDLDAAAYQVADNRSSEFASWDEGALHTILEQLRTEDALEAVGFSDEDIDALLRGLDCGAGVAVNDPGPSEPEEEAVTKTGELWVLGDHRLLCGDSTDPGVIARLMDGQKAALLATDPPYLIGYSSPAGGSDEWDEFQGDEEGVTLYSAFLAACLPHLTKRAPIYQWHASRRQALVERAWEANGLLLHQTVHWVKPRGTLGRSLFMWRSEPCFVGWIRGDMPPKNRRPPANETNVWEIDASHEERPDHPTPKPLEVFTRPHEYHTRPGEVVLEPFSGSGSQLVAAESMGRRCFAVELDPRYVDLAIRRWEQATGRYAVLEADGRSFREVKAERISDGEGG